MFVYELIDPRTQECRYIGVTKDVRRRVYQHSTGPFEGRSHRANWLRQLTEAGFKPIFTVIEEVDDALWAEREAFWIAARRDHGFDLTNSTDGGDGVRGWIPDRENVERLRRQGQRPKPGVSRALTGKKLTSQTRSKMSEACRNRPRASCIICQRELQAQQMGQHVKTHV
jgi:hypothetical protein